MAVAGTPLEFDFDYGTARFDLRYSTRRAEGGGRFPGGSENEVFVPRLHYRDGYTLRARGAEVVSRPGARTLRLESRPAAKRVEAVVTPRP